MCKRHFASGSHDLLIGQDECDDPNCPMKWKNAVPLNRAAVDARTSAGLAPHQDAVRPGEDADDAMLRLSSLFRGKP